MARILYVEDEVKIARFVELELVHEGHQVSLADNGRDGLRLALEEDFDVVLLDIMLPGLSGLEILRRLKQQKQTPVIMLTAKDDVSDKVTGLDSGAEDYLTKPFAIEELLARIRRLLRHQRQDILENGPLLFNETSHSVTLYGKPVELTKTEFELLRCFMEHPMQVLSRETILDRVWGYDYYGDTNIVDVYVRYLRNKLDAKGRLGLIQTVRGVGYRLNEIKA